MDFPELYEKENGKFSMRENRAASFATTFIFALFAVACSSNGNNGYQEQGSMSLPLTGVSNTGVTYRLIDGIFTITGEDTALDVSSNDYLGSTTADVTLAVGFYQVMLQSGWTLEKRVGDSFIPVEAVLMSDNPVILDIDEDSVTTAVFRFSAGEEIVSAGHETLSNVNEGGNIL